MLSCFSFRTLRYKKMTFPLTKERKKNVVRPFNSTVSRFCTCLPSPSSADHIVWIVWLLCSFFTLSFSPVRENFLFPLRYRLTAFLMQDSPLSFWGFFLPFLSFSSRGKGQRPSSYTLDPIFVPIILFCRPHWPGTFDERALIPIELARSFGVPSTLVGERMILRWRGSCDFGPTKCPFKISLVISSPIMRSHKMDYYLG